MGTNAFGYRMQSLQRWQASSRCLDKPYLLPPEAHKGTALQKIVHGAMALLLTATDLSNMTRNPSVVLVGTKDSKAALPKWSQKGRERRSMRGHDSILTYFLGRPVSKSNACTITQHSVSLPEQDHTQHCTKHGRPVCPLPTLHSYRLVQAHTAQQSSDSQKL